MTETWNDNSAPLLRLPSLVRDIIYEYAAIPTDRVLNLSYSGPNRKFATAHSLMLTCRLMYEEISKTIYGRCYFFLQSLSPDSLRPLWQLQPSSICSLTSLTVHLSNRSCGIGQPCCRTKGRETPKHTHSPCSAVSSTPIDAWHEDWKQHIRPNLCAGRLELNFVCDVEDAKVAAAVIAPFLEESDGLVSKDCSIRLGEHRDTSLQLLAQKAVALLTTGKPMRDFKSTFRFADLPKEIRLHILSYTDLVTPRLVVEWEPTAGYDIRELEWPYTVAERSVNEIHASRFGWIYLGDPDDTVWYESHTARGCPGDICCPFHFCWRNSFDNAGCFCQKFHAAYSSSRPCRCWAPPTALFLVSRMIRQDALEIFFKSNRFVVCPPGGKTHFAVDDPPERLPTSIFLEEVVPQPALPFVRSLEFVFPPFGYTKPCEYIFEGKDAFVDWEEALSSTRDHLNLPLLTVRAYFPNYIQEPDYEVPQYRKQMTMEQGKAILDTYSTVLLLLRAWRGMQNCFVKLAWPFEWQDRWRRYRERNIELAISHRVQRMRTREMYIERAIMGDETYDAIAAGKKKRSNSHWLIDHDGKDYLWGV